MWYVLSLVVADGQSMGQTSIYVDIHTLKPFSEFSMCLHITGPSPTLLALDPHNGTATYTHIIPYMK